jgi:hypothetical protein
MNAFEASWRAAVIGRWTARIAGTLLFLLFLAFVFGEGPPNLSRLTFAERWQALSIAALFLGLPIAWKWEGLGGLIAVAGFGLLCALSASNPQRWVLLVPALVGALHVASWGRLRMGAPASLVPWRLPHSVTASLLVVLAAFLLLCANEIFGQPPLMTPTLHPDRSLVGVWYGTGPKPVEFLIHSDGSVTGTVAEFVVAGAHIFYGRSWFGQLLHINSPYRIMGRLSGDRFAAPFECIDDTLDGSLFLQNRPMRLLLTRRKP